MAYPEERLQRYRRTPALRALLAENKVDASDLIQPFFISETLDNPKAISSLPGLFQQTRSSIVSAVKDSVDVGIQAILLFGIPAHKDDLGSSASDSEGIIQQSIRLIKKAFPDLVVIADCCLCEYTSHGHCGVLSAQPEAQFDAPQTLTRLSDTAISYAEAGVDIIAPSGMMDGMITTLRSALDAKGYSQISLMSYAVKYASAFYGPFREAAGCGDVFCGDRNHHQLAPAQREEGLREAELDVQEGADFLMVKPGMPYLDMVRSLKDRYHHPIVAYQVSGEYAMIKAATEKGWLNESDSVSESLISFKRAGADLIISYFATDFLKK